MRTSAFLNRIRSLYNIDGYQLPELTSEQQAQFLGDPVKYFLSAGERQANAIMREVERRQLRSSAPLRKVRVKEQGELLLPISGGKPQEDKASQKPATAPRQKAG